MSESAFRAFIARFLVAALTATIQCARGIAFMNHNHSTSVTEFNECDGTLRDLAKERDRWTS